MAQREKRRAYVVHRVRIGDYVPSSIKAAAAGVLRGRNVVAIGREDGQIEVRAKRPPWRVCTRATFAG